jgi:7,8-dihydropterin-6-yl-methyl-4-(beta-D-ribofuranosyl)aminobenzene 5'-phosphate synthase
MGNLSLIDYNANMSITIKIIYDNCKVREELKEGWGFSALIETKERKILFDTGNDLQAFVFNSEKLSIDYKTITDVVFSHKHRDHTTGCEEILKKLRSDVPVFLPKGFPLNKIPTHLHTQTVTEFSQLGPGIFSIPLRGGLFLQEQALLLQTEKGVVVVTGCAHAGIVNILKTAKQKLGAPIYFVLGGFHLFRARKATVNGIVAEFGNLQVQQVAPCHCSGALAIRRFQEVYQSNFHQIGVGSILAIG